MEYFYIYCLFALTTAFTSVYELLVPVLQQQEKEGKVEYLVLIYITFFVFSILIAPFVFMSCIIPTMGERFRDSLHKGLFPKE